MSKPKDLNDQLREGRLPKDTRAGVIPINEAARKKDVERPMQTHSVRELINGAAERACNPQRLADSCTTGHYKIDALTGGMRPGFVWIIGADTSWGKSTYAVSVSDENIKLGKRSLIVSVEDPPELYGDRLLLRRSRVNATRLTAGRLSEDEQRAVWDVQARAEDVPVYCFAGTKPIEVVAKELNAIIRGEGIDIVFFDYLQEFQTNSRHQDERTRFKHTSSVMRDVIRSNNKTGAILSQLTITEQTKIPNRRNIRESRDVGNAAEVIAIGFTPESDANGKDGSVLFEKGKKYLVLDKVKNGTAKKHVLLDWNDDSACFDAVADPEQKRLDEEYRRMNDGIDDGIEWANEKPHWSDQ